MGAGEPIRPTFDEPLWDLVRRTSAPWGTEFFLELTHGLATALKVQFASVSELIEGNKLRTLAVWRGEDWGDELEYDLAGTPCGTVIESGETAFFGHGVRERFPRDPLLASWGVESYLGAPLKASSGEVIGNLCLLDRRPLPDEERARAVLGPFASRAAAELDRIRTERQLTQQRAFLRQVLDINPSLIFAKDRAGRFTLVNQSVADTYGTTVEGLIGKTDADFNQNEEEVAFFRKIDLEVMDTRQERFVREESITDATGRERWLQTFKRPIVGPDGTVDQVLGVATDVTELKRAREELLERQKLEQEKVQAELEKVEGELVRQTRLATIGQVAASIAHELRNPLGSITNAVFYLRRREAALEPKWDDYLGIIFQEAQRSARIIGNLLEMSRPKIPDKTLIDLGLLLSETFAAREGGETIELEVSFVPEPFQVEADGDQLRQVLTNLITNSVQAMGDGGRIRVRGRRDRDGVVVTFSDDGPGIRPELRESVFEPLFTTKSKGTGLGLSICRQILEKHGGSIEAIPAARGATFEIRLP